MSAKKQKMDQGPKRLNCRARVSARNARRGAKVEVYVLQFRRSKRKEIGQIVSTHGERGVEDQRAGCEACSEFWW